MKDVKSFAKEPTILLVDDDKIVQEIGSSTLTEFGFRVMSADTGEQCLLLIEETKPDLILLDIKMPGVSGFEVCACLKSRPDMALVPVIMLTGSDDPLSVEKAYENGAWDFTSKPINWPILVRRCRHAIAAKHAFADARKSASLALALDNSNNVIVEVEPQSLAIRSVNQNGLQLLGYRADEVEALSFSGRLVKDGLSVVDCLKALNAGGVSQVSINGEFLSKRGQLIAYDGIAVRSVSEGVESIIIIVRDITEQRQREEVIHRLEYYDQLTGLPNSRWLKARYEDARADQAASDPQLWLCSFDLDGFRKVNESHGYEGGDLVLTLCSERLTESIVQLQSHDSFIQFYLARQGGDEFLLLIEGIRSEEKVRTLVDEIRSIFLRPIFIDGHELTITCSIGITPYRSDTPYFESMIKYAETAMYRAKAAGKNALRFLQQSDLHTDQASLLSIESQLRRAIDQHQLSVHYQPQLDSMSGELVGVEALVRWQHPTLGWVSPEVFIPLAEETSLMIKLGDWIAERVFRDTEEWLGELVGSSCEVSFNVSNKQLQSDLFLTKVAELLVEARFANQVVIELTESSVASDIERHMHSITKLKTMGFLLAIDDFGTGYSSLSYLKDLPVDRLKIDQSFVRNLDSSVDNSIVRIMFDLAESLDLAVIVEGVETTEQLTELRRFGSFFSQGYLHSPPVDREQLRKFVQECNDRKAINGFPKLLSNVRDR